MFCPNLYSEEESKLNNTSDDTSSSPCLNDPSPRIKELEAENLDLQQQLREAKTRIIELEKKIEANKNQLKISEELSQWYTDDNNYNKLTGEEIFTRREKIVFFATVLSLDINKKYTILHNLATFIAELCKGEDTDDIDNIGSFLSKMQNPKEKAANAKAAKRVSDLMQQLVPIKYRNDNTLAVNRFAESMKLNFPEEED